MQNIIGKAVRPIDSEAYEIVRSIQAYEYKGIFSPLKLIAALLRLDSKLDPLTINYYL